MVANISDFSDSLGIRVRVLGDRSLLDADIVEKIEEAERKSSKNNRYGLNQNH